MFNLNFCLVVKFRVFGVTLGTAREFGWVGLSPSRQLSWGVDTGGTVPADCKTIIDRNGVLLQVWL